MYTVCMVCMGCHVGDLTLHVLALIPCFPVEHVLESAVHRAYNLSLCMLGLIVLSAFARFISRVHIRA